MALRSGSCSAVAMLGAVVAVLAAAAGLLAGPAYRLEVLALGEAFTLLRWAAYAGLAACLVCIAGLVLARPGSRRKGFVPALAGLVVGAAVFWVPYGQLSQARKLPPIHDITTDTRNPPVFEAVLPLRSEGSNSLEYPGEVLAGRQRLAYPEIQPLVLQVPVDAVFEATVAAARDLGWRVVEQSRGDGRLEAVDTTFWFGFKDDVSVRVVAKGNGARVDVRSVSRVGVGDAGKNAARIRAFTAALRQRLSG